MYEKWFFVSPILVANSSLGVQDGGVDQAGGMTRA